MTSELIVRDMYHAGQQRWPALCVPFEAYLEHCSNLFGPDEPSAEVRTHAAELYLCCGCARGEPIAVRLFDDDSRCVVEAAIARVCRDTEFIKETLQEFRKRILTGSAAKILDYRGQGPLHAWLRVAAARLAMDRYRAERQLSRRDPLLAESLLDEEFGPESALTRAQFYQPFREALDHAILGLEAKDRNLLRLHLVGRCSIDQIGRVYQVHRATAARWLEQTRDRLLSSVRDELKHQGKALTDSEFRSVARMIGGELPVEIPSLGTDSQQRDTIPPSVV